MISDQNIQKILEESENKISNDSLKMISELDKNRPREAIEFAYNMFLVLSSDNLNLQSYENIYWYIQDHCLSLILYLRDGYLADRIDLEEMYVEIQHKQRVIPRLYLMIIIGSLIILKKSSSFNNIAFDLLDLCRCVQHPVKGLYLRKFLLSRLEIASYINSTDKSVYTSVLKFMLENFRHMNRLWVRLVYTMYQEDLSLYENAHKKLSQLVRSSLNIISKLSSLTLEEYIESVLPYLLSDVINCREKNSQKFLSGFILELFLPKFNALALPFFLKESTKFQPEFEYQTFFYFYCVIINKYLNSIQGSKDTQFNVQSFLRDSFEHVSCFIETISNTINSHELLKMLSSFNDILLNYSSSDTVLISQLISKCLKITQESNSDNPLHISSQNSEISRTVLALTNSSVELPKMIEIEDLIPMFDLLSVQDKCTISLSICQNASSKPFFFSTIDQFKKITYLIDPILLSVSKDVENDQELFQDYKNYSVIINCLHSHDIHVQTEFYNALKQKFIALSSKIRQNIIPSILDSILKCINNSFYAHENLESINGDIINLFNIFYEFIRLLPRPSSSIHLVHYLLLSSTVADNFQNPEILKYSDAFLREAFTISDEDVVNSHDQISTLNSFINCLYYLKNLNPDFHDQLIVKCEKIACSFVSYSCQCNGLINVSRLYWMKASSSEPAIAQKNSKCLRNCLEKTLNIIISCIGETTKVTLYSELINICCYYYEKKCQSVDSIFIQSLIDKSREEIKLIGNESDLKNLLNHFEPIANYFLKIK